MLSIELTMQSTDLRHVDQAAHTLRRIAAATSSGFETLKPDTAACRDVELIASESLRRSGLVLPSSVGRSLDELGLDGDRWVRAGRDAATWTGALVGLLLDVAGAHRPFYAQLGPLVRADQAFAADILPHVVHSLLLADTLGLKNAAASHLSTYFTALLGHDATAESVVRALVGVATHLRAYAAPAVETLRAPESADRWLPQLSYLVLASGAVRCGSYLNALLFIELAREHDRKQYDASEAEVSRLMYAIYAHIDEPDGFYGIKSTDVRTGLLKRYEHEHRWSAALELTGASFEAGYGAQRTAGQTADVVQALSSFGFDRLGLALLRPAQADGVLTDADVPAGLPYDLAWRTDAWDLPPIVPRSSTPSSAILYSALRAVHRERRIVDTSAAVGAALVAESGKLRTIDLDNPVAGSSVLGTLMCLHDVRAHADKLPFLELGDGYRCVGRCSESELIRQLRRRRALAPRALEPAPESSRRRRDRGRARLSPPAQSRGPDRRTDAGRPQRRHQGPAPRPASGEPRRPVSPRRGVRAGALGQGRAQDRHRRRPDRPALGQLQDQVGRQCASLRSSGASDARGSD